MRYRALDANGDYSFGHGSADFLVDTPATVAQAVDTRLLLMEGEWFLDDTEGTPYATEILGTHTQGTYDQAIRQRVLETEGVTGIVSYSSTLNRGTRALAVSVTINTEFGPATVNTVFGTS